MKLFVRSVLVLTLAWGVLDSAQAKRRSDNERDNGREQIYDKRDRNDGFRDKHNMPNQRGEAMVAAGGSDAQIVDAVENQRRVNFVEGAGMVVVKVLPDDNSGLKHQKWVVRLSSGKLMQAVYNSDMCPRVPVRVGDVMSMGGMFIWTSQGGLLHWLHHDPRGNRPDGYVEIGGVYYCRE